MGAADAEHSTPSILYIALVTLVSSFLTLVLIYLYIRPSNIDPNLPGPKCHPLWGVTFSAESKSFETGLKFDKWPTIGLTLSRQYGFVTWGGPSLNVGFGGAFFNIITEENLRHVLRDNFDNYKKGKVSRLCLKELLGNGIFTADGETWKLHRKVVTTIMSKDVFRYGAEVTRNKIEELEVLDMMASKSEEELEEKKKRMTGDDKVEGGKKSISTPPPPPTIDLQDLFFRMTIDIFVRIAFGVELDSVKDRERHIPFMEAFDEMQILARERFFDLFYEVKQRFNLTKREKRIRQCAKVVDEFADTIIHATLKKNKKKKGEETNNNDDIKRDDRFGPDLLSRFLAHAASNHETPPTNKELRDIVMNFILAGRESTACALTWTFFELTKHPNIVSQLLDEVESICGKGPKADYSYDNIEKLQFTNAVVMESLRLHPPVTDDFKMAVKDDTLPDGTYIPAGSCVMYSPYTMNRSTKIWGCDVDEFRPDRFMNVSEPSPFKFPTFNAGYRLCPGKPLALMEIKLALACLLPKFEFEDVLEHSGAYRWTLVMAMEGGFYVGVRRRTTH